MPEGVGYGGGSHRKKKMKKGSSHGTSHKMSTSHRLQEIRKRGRKHKKE